MLLLSLSRALRVQCGVQLWPEFVGVEAPSLTPVGLGWGLPIPVGFSSHQGSVRAAHVGGGCDLGASSLSPWTSESSGPRVQGGPVGAQFTRVQRLLGPAHPHLDPPLPPSPRPFLSLAPCGCSPKAPRPRLQL